jgi:hypothetical protein
MVFSYNSTGQVGGGDAEETRVIVSVLNQRTQVFVFRKTVTQLCFALSADMIDIQAHTESTSRRSDAHHLLHAHVVS